MKEDKEIDGREKEARKSYKGSGNCSKNGGEELSKSRKYNPGATRLEGGKKREEEKERGGYCPRSGK